MVPIVAYYGSYGCLLWFLWQLTMVPMVAYYGSYGSLLWFLWLLTMVTWLLTMVTWLLTMVPMVAYYGSYGSLLWLHGCFFNQKQTDISVLVVEVLTREIERLYVKLLYSSFTLQLPLVLGLHLCLSLHLPLLTSLGVSIRQTQRFLEKLFQN